MSCTKTVFADNSVGFHVVCEINPNPRKLFAVGKKVAQMRLLNLFFFYCVGLALVWGVRRFHTNIYMFSNPTGFW